MSKDVPYYDFPLALNDSGKLLRALLERSRRGSRGNTSDGDNFTVIKKDMDSFAVRFGEEPTRDAGAIAIAYLDHLIRQGVIGDPFADGTYM